MLTGCQRDPSRRARQGSQVHRSSNPPYPNWDVCDGFPCDHEICRRKLPRTPCLAIIPAGRRDREEGTRRVGKGHEYAFLLFFISLLNRPTLGCATTVLILHTTLISSRHIHHPPRTWSPFTPCAGVFPPHTRGSPRTPSGVTPR